MREKKGIGWMKNESHHSMVRQIVIAKGEAEHNVALTPFCPSRGHEFHDGCTTFHRNVPTHPAQRPWHHEGWRDTGWTGEALPRHATSAIDTIASVQPASVTDGDASLILRCWPTAPRCRACSTTRHYDSALHRHAVITAAEGGGANAKALVPLLCDSARGADFSARRCAFDTEEVDGKPRRYESTSDR